MCEMNQEKRLLLDANVQTLLLGGDSTRVAIRENVPEYSKLAECADKVLWEIERRGWQWFLASLSLPVYRACITTKDGLQYIRLSGESPYEALCLAFVDACVHQSVKGMETK